MYTQNLQMRFFQMNDVYSKQIEEDTILISSEIDNTTLHMRFSGMIDMRDPEQVVLPYVMDVHNAVLNDTSVETVEANFEELTFMNSRGIKVLITWVMKLNDLPPEERYTLQIHYNSAITWQESSMGVMKKLFPGLIVKDTGSR